MHFAARARNVAAISARMSKLISGGKTAFPGFIADLMASDAYVRGEAWKNMHRLLDAAFSGNIQEGK